VELTYFGANSWLLATASQRILIDPWLVDSLVFGNMPWLFKGDRAPTPIPPADLILLSQGLEDHAHKPTLRALDKSIPVIGSAPAAAVARSLGFEQVTALEPGQQLARGDLEIHALAGAPVGPQRENAYVLRDRASSHSLYYEPHGFPSEAVRDFAPIDVVINPVVDLELPLAGAIINGRDSALQLAQWVQPQVILPTAAGGDIDYSGLLVSLLKAKGSVTELQARLERTRAIEPPVGSAIALDLEPRAATETA